MAGTATDPPEVLCLFFNYFVDKASSKSNFGSRLGLPEYCNADLNGRFLFITFANHAKLFL